MIGSTGAGLSAVLPYIFTIGGTVSAMLIVNWVKKQDTQVTKNDCLANRERCPAISSLTEEFIIHKTTVEQQIARHDEKLIEIKETTEATKERTEATDKRTIEIDSKITTMLSLAMGIKEVI